MSNPVQLLPALGQSLWLDNIQRRQLENGELAAMIARGDIRGMTSNPSIFQHAIARSHDYDSALLPLAWSGWTADQIFWQLAIEDIRAACDLFLPLYKETGGADGYVSLEVSPKLAHQTEATVAQAKQLWEWVSRPNLMIKIPATVEGLPAIRAAIVEGININVTLIFSLERYRAVMEAYLAGLEARLKAGLPVEHIFSVASFFVSRMDTKVDQLLDALNSGEAKVLRGKAAIANAKLAYAEFQRVFGGEDFARLKTAGCRLQRPLWASTSTKDPAYSDTLYVDNLIGSNTVNTVPPQTLDAFRDHGKAEQSITSDLDDAHQVMASLEAQGVSIDRVTRELEEEGVQTFIDAFNALLATIEERRLTAVNALGTLAASVARRAAQLEAEAVPVRLHSGDPTLWISDPKGQEEVRMRLGWLTSPETSRTLIPEIQTLAAELGSAGLTHFLLLGMGGSSLAPEVLSLFFPASKAGRVHFAILDSTDPAQVMAADQAFPPEKTLYLVSSKSGGTAEVNALLDYFWERSGGDGSHFVAITDPGTTLSALANARGFRRTFLADPLVGGRYSALTAFGLVPAGLIGIDLEHLLQRGEWMARQCRPALPAVRNPGLLLGAVLAQAALDGRDKVTFLADPGSLSFGSWLEQLIAESSGKQGRGIVPVDGEPLGGVEDYGDDRLFVYLRQDGQLDLALRAIQVAGHPVLVIELQDPYELGAEFYRWEVATAIACSILGVNAFDQPDVQDSKDRTKAKRNAYSQSKKLDEGSPAWEKGDIKVFTSMPVAGKELKDLLDAFLLSARKHDYVALNAYLPRNPAMGKALNDMRLAIRTRTGCATTVGFGPRFLHSTGQLHKGGPASGLFLQITAEPEKDMLIPNEGLSFAVLERAQALGDYEALQSRGRRIMRIHLTSPKAIQQLVKLLQ